MTYNNDIKKTLVIVPCYNEEKRLKTNEFIQFSKNNKNIHFLFVDDGSQDKTSKVIKALCKEIKHSIYLILKINKGKGEAIRQGLNSVVKNLNDYEFVGYLDADLSVPLNEITEFLAVINKNKNLKFIMGIRVVRLGAKIHQKKSRQYLGRILAFNVSFILKENVHDTQCGFKLIHSSIITKLFKDEFISKWLFDIELITRFKKEYPNQKNSILEHPLNEWYSVADSKLKFKHFLNVPHELFLIWYKYRKLQ